MSFVEEVPVTEQPVIEEQPKETEPVIEQQEEESEYPAQTFTGVTPEGKVFEYWSVQK